MLKVAEASLSELQDAISNVSARLLPDLSLEIEPEILAEVYSSSSRQCKYGKGYGKSYNNPYRGRCSRKGRRKRR